MNDSPRWGRTVAGRVARYALAIVGPVLLTAITVWTALPAFVFDDAVTLLVVSSAVIWGLGPAVMASVLCIAGNHLLRVPLGRPPTAAEDVLDFALLVGVACVVSLLVTRARQAQAAAERLAARERHAREERDRLVATVAHDLATPLTAVRGTLQFVRRFGLPREQEQGKVLRRLETAAARATTLVRRLTDVQELGGLGHAQVAAIDLRAIVQSVAEMMDHVSERHPIVLDLSDAPVVIEGDAERLKRVLENLLNNAIKYSPGGGAIEVSVSEDDDHAVVTVRDHGIGIAPELRSRIFDLSYRVPETATTTEGLGLGLHIAAQIVAGHGGTIEAQGPAGGGTAIVFRLPLTTGSPAAQTAAS